MNQLELAKFNKIIEHIDEQRLLMLEQQQLLRTILGTNVAERLNLDAIKSQITRALDLLETALKDMERVGG